MHKYWSRDDTRDWIAQIEDRIDDIDHYLSKTIAWCEDNYIYDDRDVFTASFLTCIWVSQLRCETISYIELMEMLGVEEVESEEEKLYELDVEYLDLTHDELLARVMKKLNQED